MQIVHKRLSKKKNGKDEILEDTTYYPGQPLSKPFQDLLAGFFSTCCRLVSCFAEGVCQHTADGVLHEENRVRSNEVLDAELCISGFIVEELCVSSGKKRNKVHVLCLPRFALEKEKFTVLSFGTALKKKKKPEEMLCPRVRAARIRFGQNQTGKGSKEA